MPNPTLSVNDVVNVNVVMSPIAAATRSFGSLLVLGDSAVIDVNERMRAYTSITGVAGDFLTTSAEYLAALIYFSQSPSPAILYIGRWARLATSATLRGGLLTTTQQALSNFTAVASGGLTVTVDGVVKNLTGINLSAAASLANVASLVQTALSGAITCTWDTTNSRFNITSGTSGSSSTITVASAPGSGTDISGLMGLTSATATAVQGIVAETADAAVSTFMTLSNVWYGLMFAAATQPSASAYLAIAALIEATGGSSARIFGVTSQDVTTLNSTTTDLPAQLAAANYKRTFAQYSSTQPHVAAGIFGRAFTVDFNASNTTLTIKFQTESGVVAESLTETQGINLASKNCNVFVNYANNTAIVQNGTMANGSFFDEIHGTDWLQNRIQTDVFNVMYLAQTKVPQTDAGVGRITAVVSSSCEQGVVNGLIAPGVWTGPPVGALANGETLSKGYYIYAPPVSTQNASDRGVRKSPTIQCAIKLAGAIHSSNIIVNVNR